MTRRSGVGYAGRADRPSRGGRPGPEDIERLYETMEREIGPTNWWPAETLFEIMVGAVLTQNTAWGNVDRSLAALKAADALEPHAIVALKPEELQELIRPSGFYRNKARTLQSLSQWYIERCDADPIGVANMTDDELRSELLSLFGIGGETADDLVLYVFSRRAFVADTYARRLFAFLGFDVPVGYPAFHRSYAPAVLATGLDVNQLKELHGLIDEFGKAYRSDDDKAGSFLAGLRY